MPEAEVNETPHIEKHDEPSQHLPTLLSDAHGPAKGRQRKNITRAVWLRSPLPQEGGLWVHPEHYASEWLSLFYGKL